MELEIRIRGTESQLKTFLAENKFLEAIVKAGKISMDADGDNPKMFDALWDLSWETIQLAHIIFVHGTENSRGRYMEIDDLLAYKLNSQGQSFENDRTPSARVGGAKRVMLRHGLPEVLKIKYISSSDEKRYYLTTEAIPVLEQFIQAYDEEYREYLEENGFFYPGEEEE